MKKIWVLFLIILQYAVLNAQKVDSIKVEQSGEFVKIRYKILNSTSDQVFNVKVLASINGGLNTELRSISGDSGDHIPGGKPEYWVVWDVLKDVDDVKSVDFIVRADLLEERKKPGKIFNIQGAVQFPGPTFGARIGLMGKFGFSGQFTRGMAVLIKDPSYTEEPVFNRFSADFTSRLIKDGDIQLHLLTGLTVGNTIIRESYSTISPSTSIGESYYKTAITPGPEVGLALCTKRMIFTISGTKLLTGLTEEGKTLSKNAYFVFSAGFRL